jgi:hypothetical protein
MRFRFLVFSNFFTIADTVRSLRQPIQTLFNDLRFGSVAIILGATGVKYRDIYRSLTEIACSAGLLPLPEVAPILGAGSYPHAAAIIKLAQHQVFEHLTDIAGEGALARGNDWPDYWDPTPSRRKRTEFALRVFRKGPWPTVLQTSLAEA